MWATPQRSRRTLTGFCSPGVLIVPWILEIEPCARCSRRADVWAWDEAAMKMTSIKESLCIVSEAV